MRRWRGGEEAEEKARRECRSGCEDRSWPRPERGLVRFNYTRSLRSAHVHPNLSFADESAIDRFAISDSKYTCTLYEKRYITSCDDTTSRRP
ncbi:hypothetical protein ALC57_07447 [Trachymyrmex cornetzi]|uniref:Uncharacterized protein n=1 Tax=Trachymyrmex cornetzi TaxID=471704 RepID=A0A195E5I2_9HYME|nr:hypothetical protein ALC57_07447 [Trachymyrmex cornetzi]